MLKQKLILSYSTKIALQFIQIAASIVVARVAGPTVLGTVSFGLAYVTMFLFFSELGLGTAHIKLISGGRDIGKCISTYARLKYITTGFYLAMTLILFLSQKYVFGARFESRTHEYVIFISLAMLCIQSLLMIPNMTFAAKTEQAKQDVPEFIRSSLFQVSRIIVVLLGYRALALAFGHLASFILITPLIWFLFRKYPFGGYDPQLAKEYVGLAVPLIAMEISSTLVRTLDTVLLQFFTNSEQVGFYTAGYRIGIFIMIIANSVGMLFFPMFSNAASRNDYEFIKDKIDKFERFSFLFIMPAVILFAIYSDSIVMFLLGREYTPSIQPMAILTVAMYILVSTMVYGNVVTGLGYFKLAAYVNVANLLVFIVLLIFLVHPKALGLKATGAALAVLGSKIFFGIVSRYYAKKKVPIIDMKSCLKYILFGAVNFIVFLAIYSNFKDSLGITSRLLFPVAYFVLTYLGLVALKWITRNDWLMLFSILNIRALKRYIEQEIKS
jgi:O-antigen/teichoic acid export membrane protein